MLTETNLTQPPVDNGSTAQQHQRLPRRARVSQVLDVLRREYGVPFDVLEQIGDAFSRAAIQVVDEVVAGRQQPAAVAYYIARQLDGAVWWKR
jgi:hypothetical protein